MKIALILPGGVDRSGTERVIPCLLWLIERLVSGGDEVHVFALQQEEQPGCWPLLGARVHNAGRRPRRLRSLGQLFAEHRRGAFDVAHAFWAGGPGAVAAAFKLLVGVPFALTLPGGDLVALPDIGYGGQLNFRGRAWARLALSLADRVVVPSERTREQAAALCIETVRIPLGVALDRWPVAAPRRRHADQPLRLVHVASLNRVKDQETLMLAMREVRDRGIDFRLQVIGMDTLDGAVQRRCSQLELDDRVTFHGFLPHGETRSWVERSDLMVVSSRHETVPIVQPEAAVAGVPTVGTAVGQISDWAPHAAVAVPIGDARALSKAIAELACDEEERLRLAGAAQALAVAEDADFTAQQMRTLYVSLCG
ncbi:MAG TPA: glycosyltransferase family 4 protein [Sphingomicrobium sp.]|nr:glycosyltransferase family 4 protein [Sphingomicrobium sp.]